MELGLCSFGESSNGVSFKERYHQLIETFVLADQAGLDVYGIGEHHREDLPISAVPVLLSAAAMVTKRIKLSSAVTVMGSEEAVRVYEQFATVDLLSGGRAEIIVGRGSFVESFALLEYPLEQYDRRFEQQLKRLLEVNQSADPTWVPAAARPNPYMGVYPRASQPLPIWRGVGGSTESVLRAARLGLPLAIAIIGGNWEAFAPLVALYRRTGLEHGHSLGQLKVAISSHGFIGQDATAAQNRFFPALGSIMGKLAKERGWPPFSRGQYDHSVSPAGANFVGDPAMVVDKILAQHALFKHDRFFLQLDLAVEHKEVLKAIELFASQVAPEVRKHIK